MSGQSGCNSLSFDSHDNVFWIVEIGVVSQVGHLHPQGLKCKDSTTVIYLMST